MRLGATVVALSLALGGGALAVPRMVRARAVDEAARRGVALTVGRVEVGWFTASLEDAKIRLVGVQGAEATFAALRVDLDYQLHPVQVAGAGGRVTLAAGDVLEDELGRWREQRTSPGASAPSARPTTISLDIDTFAVTGPAEARLTGTGVRIHRSTQQTELGATSLEASVAGVAVHATDAVFTFSDAPASIHDARVATADVTWVDTRKGDVTPSDGASPDPLPIDQKAVGVVGRRRAPARPDAPPLPALLPDLHQLRSSLLALGGKVTKRVPEGSQMRVDSLTMHLQRGDEQLAIAAGSLDLKRASDRIQVNFSTSPSGRATPLSLRAELPTGAGDIEISVAGGPVPLGLLGMKDGGLLHLLNVDRSSLAGRGRVVLDATGQSLTFDVEGSVRDLAVRDPRLARDPVQGLDLGFSVRGLVDDKGELRVDDAEGTIGAAHGSLHGGLVQTPDHVSAAFDFEFPTSSCQALLTSFPSALLPTLSTARMDGTFSLRGRLAGDSRDLDALKFDYDVSDRCRLVEVPAELERGRFSRPFTHLIYSKSGERAEETTGPGSPNWTDLEDISPFMQVAVLTTEDGAFFHHKGFNHAAIRRAVVANVKAHRFVRGASTITMQLAKNLFLSREKTLARKLEELVLADYLEQAFTKDEMMELYLNIIEFGPDIYGVGPAAEHYFARKPSELNLAESMFLSSVLPNPIAFHRVYEDGHLGDGWMRTIRSHMDVARHTGLISPAELAEGLTQTVEFHKGDAPRPTPRPPATMTTRPGTAAEWEELN